MTSEIPKQKGKSLSKTPKMAKITKPNRSVKNAQIDAAANLSIFPAISQKFKICIRQKLKICIRQKFQNSIRDIPLVRKCSALLKTLPLIFWTPPLLFASCYSSHASPHTESFSFVSFSSRTNRLNRIYAGANSIFTYHIRSTESPLI